MALAILLAFSRAAWGGLVITAAFMLAGCASPGTEGSGPAAVD